MPQFRAQFAAFCSLFFILLFGGMNTAQAGFFSASSSSENVLVGDVFSVTFRFDLNFPEDDGTYVQAIAWAGDVDTSLVRFLSFDFDDSIAGGVVGISSFTHSAVWGPNSESLGTSILIPYDLTGELGNELALAQASGFNLIKYNFMAVGAGQFTGFVTNFRFTEIGGRMGGIGFNEKVLVNIRMPDNYVAEPPTIALLIFCFVAAFVVSRRRLPQSDLQLK